MKKIILMGVALLFMFSIAFAENNPALENHNKVIKLISKVMHYPNTAQEQQIQGYVLLSFYVDENGLIEVNQIYSNKKELKEYVQSKLNTLVIDDLYPNPDQSYEMKIVFKLE